LAGALFCINSAKKTPNIGLGRRKHAERISRDAAGVGGVASPALHAVGIENLVFRPLSVWDIISTRFAAGFFDTAGGVQTQYKYK